jgi:ABC-type transport system involved in cytochrome c biogenesis permease subunit
MKKFVPLLVLALGILYLASTLRAPAPATDFDVDEFGRLPVLVNGRLKPMDTVARTTLLMVQSRQRVVTPEKVTLTPVEWLLDVFFHSEKADTYEVFRIDSVELLEMLGITEEGRRISYESTAGKTMAVLGFLPSVRSRFSFQELQPKLPELQRQAELANQVESALRTPFQKAVINLTHHLMTYHRLKHSLVMPATENFFAELVTFQETMSTGVAAVRARQAGQPHDEAAATAVMETARRFDFMANVGSLLAIPPAPAVTDDTAWRKPGEVLLETFQTGQLDPNAMAYAGLGHAWRRGQAEEFNTILELYRAQIEKRFLTPLVKSNAEVRFNQAAPFYSSMSLYVIAFLLAVFSWLRWPETLQKSAFYLTALAFVATTVGIATRMWLEGRPPVTNLYSSALFVGWGAVGLCLILEGIYKNAVGSVAAGMIGFCTLVIAHHLSLSGDTLEMMRAVLDSNFWLATHVIVITIGYSAVFLAGFLAIVYIVRGLLTRSLDKGTADALTRMVYGIVCFATLFSLVGTILGGIWADQSWGRFWGWDPKENGALLIVIWCAIILHARWGGLIKARGLMVLAVAGNIVTAWSWFGTNMLGVGLHSYGFMDAAFWWLIAFVVSQLAIMALAAIPLSSWRSFRPQTTSRAGLAGPGASGRAGARIPS